VFENIITKWACKNTKQLRRPANCYYAVAALGAGTVLPATVPDDGLSRFEIVYSPLEAKYAM